MSRLVGTESWKLALLKKISSINEKQGVRNHKMKRIILETLFAFLHSFNLLQEKKLGYKCSVYNLNAQQHYYF